MTTKKIIGRDKEISLFEQISSSNQAEFVAVYGRRRVGKTFLIQQCLSSKKNYIECTGIKDGNMHSQLANFTESIGKFFYPNIQLKPSKDWREAFTILTKEVEKLPSTEKVFIFLDELPWLASKKSQLLQNLDYFWNTKWSKLPNFKLIACGSAASWMLDKLINAKGGLYNRITRTILLEPFSLEETKKFLVKHKFKLSDKQILNIYMVMGGIPFYLAQLQKKLSVDQNINELCFQKDGILYSEFPRLFKSLFDASELNLRIVRELAKHRYGLPSSELANKAEKTAGGRFKERLAELEAAGFIQGFIPYGNKKRDRYYRVIDEYSIFYLRWIEAVALKNAIPKEGNYWLATSKTPSWLSWAGYAFEGICFKHANKIIHALNLDQVGCLLGNWRYIPNKGKEQRGAQIDLLLDRNDNVITICEIKYSNTNFTVDKDYAKELANKVALFQSQTKTKKQIFLAMITVEGLKQNIWSEDLVTNIIALQDLF